MRILIACEESQAVCKEFRLMGHEAFSCDILECGGGHPEWHYQQDVFEVIKMGWDCMIAFPPCTYLTVTGNKWMLPEYENRFPTRKMDRVRAKEFFMALVNAPIERIAIENPIGIMSSEYRKPDQIIHPYYFGDRSRKATCLWLKNLPRLIYSKENNLFEQKTSVEPDIYYFKNGRGSCSRDYMYALKAGKDRAKIRSKTFPGVARAMGQQWGSLLLDHQTQPHTSK